MLANMGLTFAGSYDVMTQQMLALILYLLFKVEEEATDHMMQF